VKHVVLIASQLADLFYVQVSEANHAFLRLLYNLFID
jgi:hypothetical protein